MGEESEHVVKTQWGTVIEDPPVARFIFDDTRFAPVWLVVRVLVGLVWLESGLGKFGNPAWVQTGEALRGFWERAVAVPDAPARPAIAFDWYRNFLQGMLDSGAYVWFAKLVALGEFLVGVALITGAFVGVAAFIGAFMNWNFIMAGSASTNALLGLGAILLVLAWKTAGYYGLDRWLLPRLGTPWSPRPRPREAPDVGKEEKAPGVA
ncbi:MAG: DoxX family membrane protein [Anaerolineae bacterium]